MKILYVLDHFYPHIGGAETLFLNLIKELTKNKHIKVKILTSNSGGIDGKRLFKKNFEVEYCNWPIFFGHPIPNLKTLWFEIKKADVIHTSTYTAGFFSFLVNLLNRKKIILTVYENLFFKWFMVESFFRATLFFLFEFVTVHLPFDYYISISHSTKKDLIISGINEKKIIVVYPFLSENKKLKSINLDIKNNKFFLYFGRPGKTKGIFILLEAIKKLPEFFFKKFHFVFILSDDPFNEKIKVLNFIKKNNFNHKVKLIKTLPKEQLNYLIKKSFCVIVPSVTEGFGFSAYEAIHLNKPVIVSNAGSLPEIVSGRFLIFEKYNSQDLAKKIIEASQNNFEKKKVITINKKKEITKLKKLYLSLLN